MLESIIAEWLRYVTPESIAAFGTGILLGALIVWRFMRRRVRAAREQHLRGHTEIHADLRAQAELRSAAEEKNQRLLELEALLQSKEAALDRLREEISELKSTRSELETTLHKERRATEEKLHLLNEAQARLSDAFKALSADALTSNNQTFLELAETSLERFQALLLSYRSYLGQS